MAENGVPAAGLAAVEAMLARYAAGKYARPKWRERTAEEHAGACGRHLEGWQRGTTDAESGESHAVHLACRALQLVAVEMEQGRGEAQPAIARALAHFEAGLAALTEARDGIAELHDRVPFFWEHNVWEARQLVAFVERRVAEWNARHEEIAWPGR